jgi:phenylalanyl-tRNA synthetase beta chain
VRPAKDGWLVTAPSSRFDIAIAEDLVEEVGRIYGYDQIPEQPIVAALAAPKMGLERFRIHELMSNLGYHETITYSFTDPKLQQLLNNTNQALTLLNPISPELSEMRTSLWPGLITVAKHNLNRKHRQIRIFEIGLCFEKNSGSGELLQQQFLAGLLTGTVYPEQWGIKDKPAVSFFDVKNNIANIFKVTGSENLIEYRPILHPALHPKKSAQIIFDNNPAGWVGELHPGIAQALELPRNVYLYEIKFSFIINVLQKKFKGFSRFPAVQRDIAIIVDQELSWQKIKKKILDISGELLQNIELFDIYQGEGVGFNKKSLAIHLTFQALDRTLVDIEVDEQITKIINVLNQDLNAKLRG